MQFQALPAELLHLFLPKLLSIRKNVAPWTFLREPWNNVDVYMEHVLRRCLAVGLADVDPIRSHRFFHTFHDLGNSREQEADLLRRHLV